MKNHRFVAMVILPGFLFLAIFSIFPVFYGLSISFFDYNALRNVNPFIGLDNYIELIHDKNFWIAVKNTLRFGSIAVIGNIVVTLFLAETINNIKSEKLQTLFRTLVFIPCVAPMVGSALIWKYGILKPDGGVLNTVLGFFGIAPKNWFLTQWPMIAIIVIFTLWSDLGYNVVLFTAGLKGIPKECIESAIIDGASPLETFIKIKLPLMGRTFAFVAIMTMADYFQMFAQFHILAPDGGRNDCVMVLTNYIYRTSFRNGSMGYASAISAGLFLIVFAIAMIQNRIMQADWSY